MGTECDSAAFSIEVEATVPQGAQVVRESTPGVSNTITFHGVDEVPVEVKRTFRRSPDGDGGFDHDVFEGTPAILDALNEIA